MRGIIGIIIICICPLLLGTTYIVMEGDKEVGKWSENDGSDEVKYINQEVPDQSYLEETVNVTESDQPSKSEKNKGRDWQLIREKNQDFGIREGITREQLEDIARKRGLRRTMKRTERDTQAAKSYWIYEYEVETENFKHFLDVYIGEGWRVKKVHHATKERYKHSYQRQPDGV